MYATKEQLIVWRKEPVFLRLERPTKLKRAHALGYKAKQGYIVVRARIGKGGSKRDRPARGRKPSKMGQTRYSAHVSSQRVAEGRVAKKYNGLEVLNSYWVGEDGQSVWYEILLVDPRSPAVVNDSERNWITHVRGRANRGLTSEGKKGRGLLYKGKGAEKLR